MSLDWFSGPCSPLHRAWWAAAALVPAGLGASLSSFLETLKGGAWTPVPSVTWRRSVHFLLPLGSPFCSSSGLQALPLPWGCWTCRWIEGGRRCPWPTPRAQHSPTSVFTVGFGAEPRPPGSHSLLSSCSCAVKRGEQGLPGHRHFLGAGSLVRPHDWESFPLSEVSVGPFEILEQKSVSGSVCCSQFVL